MRFNNKNTSDWRAEGIAEFVAGIYARYDPVAGMLGLMQSDEARYWKNELSAPLSKDIALDCKATMIDVGIVTDLPNMVVSQH
jgi:hypothetical protein